MSWCRRVLVSEGRKGSLMLVRRVRRSCSRKSRTRKMLALVSISSILFFAPNIEI